jgi:predicted alpha/beta-fold hydrolase
MPRIESSYRPPIGLASGHLQTIFPALFRTVPLITRQRERIDTPDGDFLDLDWNKDNRASRLAILSHGLEGDAHNTYIQGMARALVRRGWDVLAWSFRGCSGEPNRQLRSYHSGATEDLRTVITHAASTYNKIALVGFSLGGNMTLKLLGEPDVHPRVIGAAAFSVPCDLASSALRLESFANRIYMRRFMRSLRGKIRGKMEQFPGRIHDAGLETMRTFREFDEAYTAPIHGFASADDYWTRASCGPGLIQISVPALLVNAQDDPFLPPRCFPIEPAEASNRFFLETPPWGGHVGFVSFNSDKEYWSERRASEFLEGL